MKNPLIVAAMLTVCIAAASCAPVASHKEPYADLLPRARALAQRILIIDTHIDTPTRIAENWDDISRRDRTGEFDYARAREGGLDGPFMSIYVGAEHQPEGDADQVADRLIDVLEGIVSRAPDKFAMAGSVEELRRNFAAGRVTLLMGMENGAPVAPDLGNLRHYRDRGIRYITLTHSKSNQFADSSYDKDHRWNGLSSDGKALVRAMNNCGIMVDISHVSDEAFYQAVQISAAPVIASHSSPRHFTPGWERNMSDDMIRLLAQKGGVIQINFGSSFLTAKARAWDEQFDPRRDKYVEEHGFEKYGPEAEAFETEYRKTHAYPFADLDDVLNAIDYVVQLVGVDHVGFGSDFDGVGDSLPTGIKDVSQYPNLIAGLLSRGYSEQDIEKIASGNLLRVWSDVENYASGRSCP